ncbi:hypothetical protein HZS_832 [Henneguya salminicola]|nr:hypothetical protein HZS_832 [Henneguya salminicola]
MIKSTYKGMQKDKLDSRYNGTYDIVSLIDNRLLVKVPNKMIGVNFKRIKPVPPDKGEDVVQQTAVQ